MAQLAYSPFVSNNALVRSHHVAVLDVQGEYALILPTVSLDSEAARARTVKGEVDAADCQAAGWKNRCRWALEAVQWVPANWVQVRPGARLTSSSAAQMRQLAAVVGKRAPRHSDSVREQLALRAVSTDKRRVQIH